MEIFASLPYSLTGNHDRLRIEIPVRIPGGENYRPDCEEDEIKRPYGMFLTLSILSSVPG